MRIVFFGTPDYVCPVLNAIYKKYKGEGSGIVGVVTQRPKPTGRKKILTYSPVDNWAHKRNIPIFYSSQEIVEKAPKADLGVLAAYGEIIPKAVISYFPHGILNIHPSLLPKFRGASPVQAVLASGEKETGVTIIKIDEELDHGPIISQFKEEVLPTDTLESLRKRLFASAAEVLVELIGPYIQGKITPREQNHKEATFTTLVKKEHGYIPPKFLSFSLKGKPLPEAWNIGFIKDASLTPSPVTIEAFTRALYPWPGAWTLLRPKGATEGQAKRLKILKAHLEGEKLVLDEVQLEGKNPVSFVQFRQAYPEAKFA